VDAFLTQLPGEGRHGGFVRAAVAAEHSLSGHLVGSILRCSVIQADVTNSCKVCAIPEHQIWPSLLPGDNLLCAVMLGNSPIV
jgi:hypothetical protein